MLRSRHIAVLALLAGLVPAVAAHAGYFELDVKPSSRVFAGRVTVRIAFVNRGDEAMRHVRPRVWFEGAWHAQPPYPSVAPNDPHTTELDVGPAPTLPGSYTAVVSMHYADRNGHPFTTLSTIPVYTGEPPEPEPLHATLPGITLRNRGKLTLEIQSQAAGTVQASCILLLPDELGGTAIEPVRLALAPGGKAQHEFSVRNAWAIPGSVYRVFAVVDYLSAERHVSTVAPGLVTLPRSRALSARTARMLWVIPGIFGIWFFIRQCCGKRRG